MASTYLTLQHAYSSSSMSSSPKPLFIHERMEEMKEQIFSMVIFLNNVEPCKRKKMKAWVNDTWVPKKLFI